MTKIGHVFICRMSVSAICACVWRFMAQCTLEYGMDLVQGSTGARDDQQ